MNFQNKSKEELINELQELQQANNALKVSVEAESIAQKHIMKALQTSEERFQLLFNKAPLGYQSLDFDGNFIEVNQQWLDTLGYKYEEVIGKWFGDFLTPVYKDGFRKRFPIFKELGKIHSEFEMIHKNGSVLFIAFDGRIGYDVKGNFKQTHCILQDITEKKHTEKTLIESEETFRKLFEDSSDAILFIDASGVFVDCNQAALDLLKMTREQFILQPPVNISPEYQPNSRKSEEAALEMIELAYKKGLHRFDWTCIDANGCEFIVEVSLMPILLRGQTMLHTTWRNITHRIKTEKELKEAKEKAEESEEKYRLLYESMNQGLALHEIITDENGNPVDYVFLDINASYTRLLGVTREMSIGKRIKEVMPKVEQYWIDIFGKVALTGESNYFENYLEATGRYYSTYSYCPKKNQFAVLVNDITEQRKVEEEKRIHNEMLQKVLNTIPQFICWKDINSVFLGCNNNYAKLVGLSDPQLIIGKTDWDLPWKKEETESFLLYDRKIMESDTAEYNIIEMAYSANGRETYLNTNKVPLHDANGNVNGILVSFEDITERIHAEDGLKIAKLKAEESERLKSAFLANMSHEIRTPMNGILGFAELLKEPNLTGEQQQEYIRIIEKSGLRMLNIINDIVDISKIEANLMNVDFKDCNINDKVEFIYNFFKPQVEEKGIKLFFKNSLPSKESIIRTDNEKVYSILTNLVKNAIKYSDKGTIEFGYLKRGETLEFYVKDTGIGIPIDRQSAIFERFIQADITDKFARQGAGLGLSISKAYVEMLGGKIWVESEEGIGSTFFFTLPYNSKPEYKAVQNQDEKNQINPELSGLKILIAEDDETSEKLITIEVEKFSKNVLIARTGKEVVEFSRNNPDIDLILMDIQMPVMNGYEATRQIRQFNKDVVIIAQTALGLIDDREKAIEAGCNDYISKPIKKDELLSLILKYFKK